MLEAACSKATSCRSRPISDCWRRRCGWTSTTGQDPTMTSCVRRILLLRGIWRLSTLTLLVQGRDDTTKLPPCFSTHHPYRRWQSIIMDVTSQIEAVRGSHQSISSPVARTARPNVRHKPNYGAPRRARLVRRARVSLPSRRLSIAPRGLRQRVLRMHDEA